MGSKKSTTTSRMDLPDWLTSAGEQATNMGTRIGSRAYTPYYGRRFADLSGNEQQGINLAAQGNGRAEQLVEQGTNLLASSKSWEDASDAERKAYEEPIFQATTRPAIDQVNSQYDTRRENLVSKGAMMQGQGNDAYALSKMALDKNVNSAVGDISARGRYQAFQQAQQQWGSDQARKQQVGQALIASGGNLSSLNAEQIRNLMMTGGAERVLQQSGLDFDYGQFLENRDWDITNLGPLLAALRGTSGHYDTVGTNIDKQAGDPLGQLIGLGSSLAGSYYNWGGGGGGVGVMNTPQLSTQPTSTINSTYNPNLWAQPGPVRPA